MENTEPIRFKDDAPRWFVASGDSWIGPLFASEVYKKVISHEISWAHFVWAPDQSGWMRICDTEAFASSVPQKPAKKLLSQLKGVMEGDDDTQSSGPRSGAKLMRRKRSGSQSIEIRDWFLYFNDSQFGPFSKTEVERFLQVGKIHDKVHAWKEGMVDWERIHDIPELRLKAGVETKKGTTEVRSQRASPRRPLVAHILLSNEDVLIAGVCRDISVGGMQVLTDQIPGKAGAHIRLNVSPSGSGGLSPFVAEGVIVRLLEDGRGFSFRFENLSEVAKRAIEKYIQESE